MRCGAMLKASMPTGCFNRKNERGGEILREILEEDDPKSQYHEVPDQRVACNVNYALSFSIDRSISQEWTSEADGAGGEL